MTTDEQRIEAPDARTSGMSESSLPTARNNTNKDLGSITPSVDTRGTPHRELTSTTSKTKTSPTSSQGTTTRIRPKPKPTPKSISALEAELASLETQLTTTLSRLAALQQEPQPQQQSPSPSDSQPQQRPQSPTHDQQILDAQAIFTRHIAQLRRYNDIKDAAMGMLSLIADREGKRVAEVLDERGVLVGDD
ncbi:hypothetical protein LTR84_008095 [Exophiala bonariae]|uniref:Swi5-domain-containing protein n=1 Tax=Exophiala bonariae TaxID=1690606 RepID=A0AAV9NLX3_9EURO|nr:hypothetical protein LTR84_008095 [Exophiala bonariae]